MIPATASKCMASSLRSTGIPEDEIVITGFRVRPMTEDDCDPEELIDIDGLWILTVYGIPVPGATTCAGLGVTGIDSDYIIHLGGTDPAEAMAALAT